MPFCGYARPIATQHWIPGPGMEGPTVSPYSSRIPEGYVLVGSGYDVSWSGDGTEGRGKEPWLTLGEAESWARSWNDQRVKGYLDVNRCPPYMEPGTPISLEVYRTWQRMFPGPQPR